MVSMFEIYDDWFGGESVYPHDNDSDDCENGQEYSRKLGCIEVTVDDIRRAQAKEAAKHSFRRNESVSNTHALAPSERMRSNGWHADEKVREHLAKIGFYQRWYRSLMRKLRRLA